MSTPVRRSKVDPDLDTPAMPAPHVRERVAFGTSGIPIAIVAVVALLAGAALIPVSVLAESVPLVVLSALLIVASAILGAGLIMVAPGQARVMVNDADGNPVEIAARVESAGVHVIESRLTHLAYAPEIAGAMLRRQQASAVVAARQRIVEGAVGMVELALERLASHDVVDLDEERKAAMVSNLLVVLCGDREPQPVVNTGTLYQ